jgi:geranylgeranyl diphosphate synthase type II
MDLETEKRGVALATVDSIHARKTGALILASLIIGARAGGATRAALKRISRYGEALGLAFQIADDLLDTGAAGASGESGRKEDKKATYPSVAGVEQARTRLRELMDRAVKSLSSFDCKAEPLRAMARYVGQRALNEEKFGKQENHS